MNYNGIHGKRFILEQDDCLIELRYDQGGDLSKTGIYISKDNGSSWKKVPDLDDLSKEVANAIATIQSGLSTPINIALESQLPDLTGITDWVASTSYSVGDLVLYNNTVYKCITANSDAQFTDTNWDVVCKDGTYYSIQEMDVTAPGRAGRAWYNSAEDKDSWQLQFDHQGRPITEYDNYSNNDVITEDSVVTVDKVLYRATKDVTCHANWNTDKTDFEELKTSGAILNEFVPNHYYAENEMIVEDGYIYTRKTAGISLGTLGDDIANWKTQTKLHQDGQRYVSWKIGTLPQTPSSTWTYLTNFIYVDGDASMLGIDEITVPVDGLYYINIPPIGEFGVSATNKRSAIEIQNSDGTCIDLSYSTNFSRVAGVVGMHHLKQGEKIKLHFYGDTNLTALYSTAICEFGLIAEDQSTNVIVEANLVLPTRVTANTNFYAVTNISNPSAMKADGTIIIPEDGLYLLSMDAIASTSGGAAGALETTIFKNSEGALVNQNAIADLYTSGTNMQAEGITRLIEVEKGDTISIRLLKGVTESNIGYGANMKPKIRLVKVKSTEVKLTAKDLYNEYVNDLEVGVKPQSYESFIKSLVQREAMHMECNIPKVTLQAGTIVNNLTVTQGEDLLEDGTKLTAPVSGLYHVHIITHVAGQSTSRIGLMKNTTNYYDDLWVAVSETDQKHVFQNSLDTTIWLNAGDYITIANVYAVTDLQGTVEFSLIPCGTDTINQFNVWVPDEEYNLGNGLYGVRKVVQGTTNSDMIIDLSQYNIAKLEKVEGTADVDTGVTSALIPCYYTNVAFINVWYNKTTKELHLVRGTQYSKATDVFDFSLIYTKNN